MLRLPWFIPYNPRQQESVIVPKNPSQRRRRHFPPTIPPPTTTVILDHVRCSVGLHLSDQQRLRVPLSRRYLHRLKTKAATDTTHDASSSLPYGWLLLHDSPFRSGYNRAYYEFTLFNPITRVQIQLPHLGFSNFMVTISPPPRLDVFALTSDSWGKKLHLFRRGDPDWTYVWFDRNNRSISLTSVIYYQGKLYCICLDRFFIVFDVESHTEPQYLEMDECLLPEDDQLSSNLVQCENLPNRENVAGM